MSLTDGEILELLQLTTRLTLHYESVIAGEQGLSRPYGLSPTHLQKGLRRLQQLLERDGRTFELHLGGGPYLDDKTITTSLAQVLDVVAQRYDLDEAIANKLGRASDGNEPMNEKK